MGEETDKLVPSAAGGAASSPLPAEGPAHDPAEKIIGETDTPADEQTGKLAEPVENAEDKAVVDDRELIPPLEEGQPAVPFIEESYYVKDLKDSEKKALQNLKGKIAEAIKNNTFLAPPKPAVVASKEVEVEKQEEKKEEEEELEKKDEVEGVLLAEKGTDEGVSAVHDTPEPADFPPVDSRDAPVPTAATGPVDDPPVATEATGPVEELAEEEKKVLPPPPAEESTGERDGDITLEAEDNSPSLEDLTLWGIPLLHTKGDERTDVILLKFLHARDFKVNEAMAMLKGTVVWRKEFEADNLLREDISGEFDSVAYMHGVDKEGHPVCYNHYGVFQDKELYQKTFGDDAQFKKFLRWRIQVLERGMQQLDFSPSGVHSMVQVIDLKDSPGFVKRRNITKKAFDLLQDNYPELVAKQIFINVPWYFGALYSLHGKFMTARSKSKVVIVRPEKVTDTLYKYIRPENLPVRYGGLGRPNDTDFEGVERPVEEVTLKVGEKQTFELPEQEVGSTVVWDVVVVGWDVVYGEEFVPGGEGKYTVIIRKAKKVTATEEPLRNSFKATTDSGKVVITIENTSRKKKLVVYRHTIKNDIPTEG